jgi:20S proteasome alpha/beta subunit
MTLIIALKASDGIVMAADGQESIPTGSGIIRAHVAKIERLGRSAAWAGSGDVTYIQRARRALDKCVAEKGLSHFALPADIESVSDAIVDVRARLLEQANATAAEEERESPTYDRTDVPAGELLLAHYAKDDGRIYQVDSRGFETEIEARFAAIGIADVTAYALLRPFTDADLASMTVAEAAVLAFGMINDAIEVSGDIGPPIHVWVVDGRGPRLAVDSGDAGGVKGRLEALWAEYSAACKSRFAALAAELSSLAASKEVQP